MTNEFEHYEKEFDDQVYEDDYYEENFDEEELVDDDDREFEEKEEVEEEEEGEGSGSGEQKKIHVSYACEDCDYRWDDIIIKKGTFDDEEETDAICPMCGSLNVDQI
jgi:rubrerythrin